MTDRRTRTATTSSRRARALVAGAFATAMVGTSGAVAMRSVMAATPPATTPTADTSDDGWFDDTDTPLPSPVDTATSTTSTTVAPTTTAAPTTEAPTTEVPPTDAPPVDEPAAMEEPAPAEEPAPVEEAPPVEETVAAEVVVEEPPATDPPATDPPATAARKPTRSPRTTACTGSKC